MGFEDVRNILLKHAVLEHYNTGYKGFTLGTGPHARTYQFDMWGTMCMAIDMQVWNSEILLQSNRYFRFWSDPVYRVSGRFFKTILS